MNLEKQIKEIERGTVDITSKEELIKRLEEKRPLNIKFGVDPTAPDIHLGHTVPLQKLKQFQELGHNIHLIIGDYTAMIGDPSGKSETRPTLTKEEINHNLKTYKTQVFKVIDPNKTNLLYNSSWLGKFSGEDIINLGTKYTVQQLLQRRDFSERIKKDKPLSVTELLYPLLVGYDSVHLKTDIELGGTDQLFNFKASRHMQRAYNQDPEVIITLPLLEGTDGIKKMSKSLGNSIGVKDNPDEMYGKIMSISDDLMIKYYELLSSIPMDNFKKIRKDIYGGNINPMEYKKDLAKEIVTRFHGEDYAIKAEENFRNIHRKKMMPDELEDMLIKYTCENDLSLVNILKSTEKANSNGEAKRLIEQGAVKIDGNKIQDIKYVVTSDYEKVLQVGKRYFKKLSFDNK